jgi:hypothetical protein
VLLAASAASAITQGELDAFTLDTEQWQRGMLAIGGPASPSDPFLLLTADGVSANGRLVTFNQMQWSGDYTAASVTAIAAWLNNLGSTDLDMRVALGTTNAPSSGGSWYASSEAVTLPAGSGWTPVVFPIGPSDLQLVTGSASYATVMQSVMTLRLLHTTTPSAFGTPVVATLGVDRIVAVPEPGAVALGSGGILALGLCARSARARREDPRPCGRS